jgi:hypothetical protein
MLLFQPYIKLQQTDRPLLIVVNIQQEDIKQSEP